MATISTDIAKEVNIIARAGDSFSLKIDINNTDNSSFDLTGYNVYFEIKSNVSGDLLRGLTNNTASPYSDSGSRYSTTAVSLGTPTDGVITISETSANMDFTKGTYKYVMRLESSAGNLKTWMYGNLKINSN